MIGSFWALLWSGALDLLRRRFYASALAAGGLLMGAALALDALAAGETSRVLTSIGLAFSALIGDIVGVVGAIAFIGREIESRQAIQILVRPIERWVYLLSRWAALFGVVVITNLALGCILALLVAITATEGAEPGRIVVAALCGSLEAGILIAVAILVAAGSSTTLAGVVTAIVFAVGRLDHELALLVARKAFGAATVVVDVAHGVLPQLTRFDLTGWVGGDVLSTSPWWVVVYAVLYTAAVLLFASFRFSRLDLS